MLDFEAIFNKAVQTVNPLGRLSHHHGQYANRNVAEKIRDIDPHLIEKIILWSAKTEKHSKVFLEDHPIFAFLDAWNKISADYLHEINRPPIVGKKTENKDLSDAEIQAIQDFYLPGSPHYREGDTPPTKEALKKAEIELEGLQQDKAAYAAYVKEKVAQVQDALTGKGDVK